MSKRHKWADVIVAFAEGKAVQYKHHNDIEWQGWGHPYCPSFGWAPNLEWRIKPAEPIVVWKWAYEAMRGLWNEHPNFMTDATAESIFGGENFRGCRYIKLDWSRTEIPSGEY